MSDPSATNVCTVLPGAEVAKALGRTFRSEKPVSDKASKLSRCVYLLEAAGRPEGFVVWLYAPSETTAADGVSVLALAKLALERFDRQSRP